MRWPRFCVNKSRDEMAMEREIAFHVEAAAAAKIAQGVAPEQARRQALIEFGGREQVKQQLREVHVSAFVEALRWNWLAALRFIQRSPMFALTIVLTLALGIGANSVVFSAIDAVLLRPLTFPHADELVRIHQRNLKERAPEYFVAPVRVEDWNRMSTSFQCVSGYYTGDQTLAGGIYPEKITVALVAPRFLALWGIAPAHGRDFTAAEQKFGGPNAVIVTDRFWRNTLHGDLAAVGKSIHLGSQMYTVVGVLPARFRFPNREVDVFEPSPMDAPYAQGRDSTWFTVFGRLKPGVARAAAQAELTTVQRQLRLQFAKTDANFSVDLEPLKAQVVGGAGKSLWLFYGATSLLLVIACTNIAALLMARTAEREHEIAIRYALGATRTAIVGQLLSEVLVLAFAGALLGLAVAGLAMHGFALVAKDLPRVDEIRLNWRLLAYSLGCGLISTLVCGLIPAIRGTQRNLSGQLAQGSRLQVPGQSRGQWLLVGVQVAMAVTLVVASGLLLRSLAALGKVNPGFDPEHVLTLRISATWAETVDTGRLTARIRRTLEKMRALPGVEAAATASEVPGNSEAYPAEFRTLERGSGEREKMLADIRLVSAGYFATLHIPLLEGEECRSSYPSNTMLVNRSFVDKYVPNGQVVGLHLQQMYGGALLQAVPVRGIVSDVREQGVETAARPMVYWCSAAPTPDPYFLLRTRGDAAAMAETLRQRIHEWEPERSVFGVMPLEERLDDRQAESRLRTVLLTSFAATAVGLVVLGLYGTISYQGRVRRREVGLRLALGALPRQIVQRFLAQGLRVAVAGGIIGLGLSAWLTRLLAGMLYGVSSLDPATYVAVFLLTLAIALGACFLPSLRAGRVNAMEMLREE